MFKFATEESIVRNWKLGFVGSLRINNPDIGFLSKVPGIKIFSPEVPNTDIVQRNQNCCPSSRIDLKMRPRQNCRE